MDNSLWNLLKNYKVVIPIIQRDYAQGRRTEKVTRIRQGLLSAIFSTLAEPSKRLELDFIYGHTLITEDQSNAKETYFYPLDGQQRLTTLFLLHWFIAVRENKMDEAAPVLSRFSYETRHSSRVFCAELVKYNPGNSQLSIKQNVINQPWFFAAWRHDPTIDSMLTMLDEMQKVSQNFELKNVWEKLTSSSPITFHLLPMDQLGLADDLYIKMNSRGKELTDFEYFKIIFAQMLETKKASLFNHRIDQEWSDLFWDLFKNDDSTDIAHKVDSGFLRFYQFITDMLIASMNDANGDSLVSLDSFKEFHEVYSANDNVEFLFSALDQLVMINNSRPRFFEDLFYIEEDDFEINKVRLFFQNPMVDLFKKCSTNYDPKQRTNPFSIGEQLLLYACIIHLLHKTDYVEDRMRKVRNLVSGSEDTVRRENMGALLNSVKNIMLSNVEGEASKFSKAQSEEEKLKEQFLLEHPDLKRTINELEDHHLLQGCVALFRFEPGIEKYATAFRQMFHIECDFRLIGKALFTMGDYTQQQGWKTMVGNSNASFWRDFFVPSQRRNGFNKTQAVAYEMLDRHISNPALDLNDVVAEYLKEFVKDTQKERRWSYYYIKYESFGRNEDGFYYWANHKNEYECKMMRRTTLGGYHWDPFLREIKMRLKSMVNMDNYGAPLVLVKEDAAFKILCTNSGYLVLSDDPEGQLLIDKAKVDQIINDDSVCPVRQSENGFDIEDRIDKGIELIHRLAVL